MCMFRNLCVSPMVFAYFAFRAYMQAKMLKDDQAWVVVVRPSCTNICFWYVPQKLRPFDPCQEGGPKRTALHRVAPYIKARMQKEGCAMIGFQIDATVRNGHDVNFFRMVFASCDTVAESDVDEILPSTHNYTPPSLIPPPNPFPNTI